MKDRRLNGPWTAKSSTKLCASLLGEGTPDSTDLTSQWDWLGKLDNAMKESWSPGFFSAKKSGFISHVIHVPENAK